MYAALAAIMLAPGFSAAAQSPAEPGTRVGQMEQQQQTKAGQLTPQGEDKAERTYERVINFPIIRGLMANQNGFGIQFGTLYPGAGFSLGPVYNARGLLNENMNVNFAAIGSLKQYYELRAGASFRHLANERAILDLEVRRLDAPQVHYYGPGNASLKDNKTNYRLEAGLIGARLAAVPFRRILRVGVTSGYSWLNVGPGQASSLPSTETVFGPAAAPGINQQPDYFRAGPFVEVDWRDTPGDPHRGGSIGVNHDWHFDQGAGAFSFRSVQAYVEQYFPFLNQKRVFALRGRVNLTYTGSGKVVPFYMQPTLGGPNDLRGYSQFRFYDNNSLILNGEYRRELGLPLDFVLFTDWGKVSPKRGQLAFSELHGSGGFGLRFKTRNTVVMRMDLGFSPEGVRFWWTFNDIFRGFLHNLY
jgi:outer membrane protein assembly factor BamA